MKTCPFISSQIKMSKYCILSYIVFVKLENAFLLGGREVRNFTICKQYTLPFLVNEKIKTSVLCEISKQALSYKTVILTCWQ